MDSTFRFSLFLTVLKPHGTAVQKLIFSNFRPTSFPPAASASIHKHFRRRDFAGKWLANPSAERSETSKTTVSVHPSSSIDFWMSLRRWRRNIKIRHKRCGAQATWGSSSAKGTGSTVMVRICAISGSDCQSNRLFQSSVGQARFERRPTIRHRRELIVGRRRETPLPTSCPASNSDFRCV